MSSGLGVWVSARAVRAQPPVAEALGHGGVVGLRLPHRDAQGLPGRAGVVPRELDDLAGGVAGLGDAPWVGPMRGEAERWLEAREAVEGEGVMLSEEQRDRLRTLGYLQ